MNLLGRWKEEAVAFLLSPDADGCTQRVKLHNTEPHGLSPSHQKQNWLLPLERLPLLSIVEFIPPEIKFKNKFKNMILKSLFKEHHR